MSESEEVRGSLVLRCLYLYQVYTHFIRKKAPLIFTELCQYRPCNTASVTNLRHMLKVKGK